MFLAVAGLVRDEGDLLAIGIVQSLALAGMGVMVADVAYKLYEAERQRMMKAERQRRSAKEMQRLESRG